ncbi:MAG: ferredoxin reductase [Frankiales bacterium]|nr:ferredoxin reductase [Frankiales bacterium]
MTALEQTDRVVVVGAGLAGLNAVEALRRSGFPGPVTLLGQEQLHPYDRPPLSKQVLQGSAAGPAYLRPPADYDELDLELLLGRRATGLDTGRRVVHLDDGTALPYDVLVLAVGAAPRWLPGAEGRQGVHVLRTYDDGVRLHDAVRAAGSLAVVGGGPLGLEAAASARMTGARVDLVEQLAGPMAAVLGPRLVAAVTALHVAAGISLHLATGVAGVLGTDRVSGLALTDGTTLEAPVVLLALGVVPSTSWLDGSGVELLPDGAVRCDASGRTSAPGVWAVGDAAGWQDQTGRHRRIEHWTSAVDQAATVAGELTGTPTPRGLPYSWSDQYASTLQVVGEVGPHTEVEVHPIGDGLLALHADRDRLLGVVALDARRQVGRARKLLRAGAGVDEAREAFLR